MQGCAKEELVVGEEGHSFNPKVMILGFLKDVRGRRVSGLKSAESFSADSAVWYIEAGLNFTAGNLELAHEDSWEDSVSVPLNVDVSGISEEDVYDAFDALLVQLAPWVNEEQHIVLVDVLDASSGDCELKATVQLGSGYSKGAPSTTYGPKDCYYYGGSLTQQTAACACGCTTLQVSWCSNRIIQNRINSANLVLIPDGSILNSVETWKVWNFDNIAERKINLYNPLLSQAPLGDGYHDTKTYSHYINGPTGPDLAALLCLSPTEMSYWTGNATDGHWSSILAIRGAYCPNKIFLGCTINQALGGPLAFFPSIYPTTTGIIYWHRSDYRYGLITPG